MRSGILVWIACGALVTGCTAGSGKNDDGGLPDGDNHDGFAGDIDLDGNLALIVPEEITLCSVFREYRSAHSEYLLKTQLDLNAGVYLLPQDQELFDLEMLGELDLTPEHLVGTPLGPGRCTHELQTDPEQPNTGSHNYECNWDYDLQGQNVRIEFNVSFFFRDGQFDSEQVRFEEPWISYPMFEGFIGPGSDYDTEQFHLASCTSEGIDLYRETYNWENGDVTIFDVRKGFPPLWFYPGYVGETTPANLVRADVTIDGNQQVTSDYYRLVYAAHHHNAFTEYLTLLDPPLGDVHALYTIQTGLYGESPPEELLYLGTDLDIDNPVRTSGLASYAIEQP